MRLTIERAALLKALGHVQSVVERRNTIPILSNVLLAADRGSLAFSATDLDMEIIDEASAEVEGSGQITAPAHTLYEIVRKLPEGADVELRYTAEDPRLQVSPAKVRLDFGGAALTSKVIDGSFPDYGRVIPRDNTKILTLDNALFAQAVDRVATISAEKSRSVKLAIESGRMVLTVRNMEAGQAVEELEIDYSGDAFEIGFNARYLLDVTDQIQGETTEFRFADPASPTLVIDPSDSGVQYVLMPLRV